jgi:hypothetical protein
MLYSSLNYLFSMPASSRKTSSRKAPASVQRITRAAVYPVKQAHGGVCHSCNALPAGSIEVAAILLVLVFSLSAVLFTSVYATKVQTSKVQALEAQLSTYQPEQK